MKKESLENIKNSLPSLFTNLGSYLKSIVNENNLKELIGNGSGSIGFLVSLFGKPIIDNYFDKKAKTALKENGFDIYLEAAFQTSRSVLQNFFVENDQSFPSITIPLLELEKEITEIIDKNSFSPKILTYQPKYHPAVVTVKDLVYDLLKKFGIEELNLRRFIKHFNSLIEEVVDQCFGENLDKHKKQLEDLWLQENETKLLFYLINHNKIGFVEQENLKYEEAFGMWLKLSQHSYGEDRNIESNLQPVEKLIEEYFDIESSNHLEKVLFLVADFGKGKSVFLKHYAATLALNYLETGEGYFPIYFNLRNFAQYSSETNLGVIEDFLQTKYAIKINSDYFKKKKFIFLLDSLDESCDLSKTAIEKVLNSIKKIQNIDKLTIRENRVIITSRPFSEQLFHIISNNKPYNKVVDGKDVQHFISLYGFKKEQFNDWLYESISQIVEKIDVHKSQGFIKTLIASIRERKKIDIYHMLSENETLKASELRRPIFAYMVYQLIRNNINVIEIGKIGIYLSFINLLSKEAKYIHDPNVKDKIKEQFEARNILHHIAALWTYQRQSGNQGALKKADICRMLGNFNSSDTDAHVLENHQKNGGSDIEFLSHSYFGENNDLLHFQHQSFAEILLAEYYIKVIMKYALDRSENVKGAIEKLKIGYPTQQTVEFLREILIILKESTITNSNEVIEKRKLLLPLLASIATIDNNKNLSSTELYYEWYEKGKIDETTSEIPSILLHDWGITRARLDKIVSLCEQIILNSDYYLLTNSEQVTNLFDKELVKIPNQNFKTSLVLEKELALIIGNRLFNYRKEYFVNKFSKNIISELITSSTIHGFSNEFKGIQIKGDQFEHRNPLKRDVVINSWNLHGIDFSDAKFEGLIFIDCTFFDCNFKTTSLKDVVFHDCRFVSCKMGNKLDGYVDFNGCFFDYYQYIIPRYLTGKMFFNFHNNLKDSNKEENSYILPHFYHHPRGLMRLFFNNRNEVKSYFKNLSFYFTYALKKELLSAKDFEHAFVGGTSSLAIYLKSYIKIIVKDSLK